MRLWLRLTLTMAVLTLVPLVIVGAVGVRAASENATLRPEEQMRRDASTLATFVGSWIDSQARTLEGWQRVWDVRTRSEDHRIGLLRAAWQAMDNAVTVALVDGDGRSIVPPQYMTEAQAMGGRIVGTAARADALIARVPKRLSASGVGIGEPYSAPGSVVPVVPIAVGATKGMRMVAEISLDPVAKVFAGRDEWAAVLVDGAGNPVIGGDHPLLESTNLQELLDYGIDVFVEIDGQADTLRGAVYAVPKTDWKVVVVAPPFVTERAAAAIRQGTVVVAGLALFSVMLAGLAIERTITRSVQQLRRHAGEVTKGSYDQRNLVDRGDEIGDLGLALNVMSSRLETNAAELQAFHDELQDRVAARTADLEQAQAQLVRAGQVAAVAEMGAGLAHELNNPLAALLGQIQLIRAGLASDEPGTLDSIEDHALRMRDVVEEIVRLSGADAGEAVRGESNLFDVVRGAVDTVADTAADRDVKTVLVKSDEGLVARMDGVHARRVLVHLIGAVVAGLDEGDEVRIAVKDDDDGAAVWLVTNRPVDEELDDWRAAGMRLWAARALIELAGGHIDEPTAELPAWRAVFPGAA